MKRNILQAVILMLTAFAMFTIGCKSSGDENQTTAAAETTAPATPKVDTVIIQSMQFQPADLHASAGDTIIWINKGIVAHNVTEDTARTWTSGDINVGSSWKRVADNSFNYLCTIHPTMKGSVTVTKE